MISLGIIALIKQLKYSDPAKQKAVVQQDNASQWKLRDTVTGHIKPRAHVLNPGDDIFKQDHDQEEWNSHEDVINGFIISEGVLGVMKTE